MTQEAFCRLVELTQQPSLNEDELREAMICLATLQEFGTGDDHKQIRDALIAKAA